MEHQTKHPLRDKERIPSKQEAVPQPVTTADGTRVFRPIDGSQYLDVIEEQEYADRRPSAEEQKPRFSYLRKKEHEKDEDQQQE